MRYFFDVLGAKSRAYDFHGHYFDKPEDASNMAELIAMDLGCTESDDWAGSHVQVRNAAGDTLFSTPVLIVA